DAARGGGRIRRVLEEAESERRGSGGKRGDSDEETKVTRASVPARAGTFSRLGRHWSEQPTPSRRAPCWWRRKHRRARRRPAGKGGSPGRTRSPASAGERAGRRSR